MGEGWKPSAVARDGILTLLIGLLVEDGVGEGLVRLMDVFIQPLHETMSAFLKAYKRVGDNLSEFYWITK